MFSLSANKSTLWLILPGIMPARIEFTDEQLEEMTMMYQYGFSSYEIADWFGVSYITVLRRLRERNVKIRPARAAKSATRHSYVKRKIPDPWADIDAAYIFGVLIGDASMGYEYKEGTRMTPKSIVIETPDEEFGVILSATAESAFGIIVSEYPSCNSDNATRYVVRSVDLGRSYDRFKWRLETWQVPKPFFNAPEEVRIALCQGKFDSDGKVHGKTLQVASIHRGGLKDISKIVRSLGFRTEIEGPFHQPREEWSDYHILKIRNASPELFRLPRKKNLL